MANNLTGEYEAVVEIALRQINGLLAILHQRGGEEEAPLKLLHSISTLVGGRPRHPPGTDVFGDWVLEYRWAHPGSGQVAGVRGQLVGTVPPGAARMLETAFAELDEFAPPEDDVRGRVEAQVSTVTVSVAPGSTSEVALHLDVRARYHPAPGTTDLPAPIHGEVRVGFEVRLADSDTGRRLLIQPTADDSKMRFLPATGSGLGAPDAARIAVQVRKLVRRSFRLIPVDLPADFPFTEFRGVGTGTGEAIALPLQLSGAAAPPGLQGVTQSFVGSSGFAVAVSRDFVQAQFQRLIDNLLQFRQSVPIRVGPVTVATYHASVTSAELRFNDGSIDFIVEGKAHHWFWPDYSFNIRQRITLVMLADTLFIVAEDDELTISGLPGGAADKVRLAVIAERNRSLPPAQDDLNERLRDAKTKLTDALSAFDGVSVRFRAGSSTDPGAGSSGGIAITPDGVIVRGDLRTGTTPAAPVVDIEEIEPGKTYGALHSWIPGGWIERLEWSWVERRPFVVWGGEVKTQADEHRFLLSIPAPQPGPGGLREVVQVCLRLVGRRILPDGSVQEEVVGGTTCRVREPEVVLDVPSWWEPVTVPVWRPGVADGVAVREAIAGHVTVQADHPRAEELTQNSLVYFADWRAEQPLAAVASALPLMRRRNVPLSLLVVVPAGTFDGRRREVEAKLASLGDGFPGNVHVTEDDEGGWTRTFAASRTPAIYLVDARRRFAWKHEGEPEPRALAAALDQHLVPAPVLRRRPLRLAVATGQRAPDAVFQDDRGRQFALHRLRGRPVILTFWQAWSAPCLRELARLQAAQGRGGKVAPFVVGFHGGKDAQALGDVRRRLELTFVLAQDAHQRVARAFGVRCWPTTVHLDPSGRVEHVRFGFAPDGDAAPGRPAPACG